MSKCVYQGKKHCMILAVSECPKDCKFFKNERQLSVIKEKVRQRLNDLPPQKQLEIAVKYYAGKLVWKINFNGDGANEDNA